MCAYSIDLGIHPDAKGRHDGSVSDPYPLQIALTQGILVPERGDGPYTGFTPLALASFNQLKRGDLVICRVFEISSICGSGVRCLEGVDSIKVTFNDIHDGVEMPELWTKSDKAVIPLSKASTNQRSLAFTSVPGGTVLPCFFEWGSKGIITYEIMPPNALDPSPFLFSVLVYTHLDSTETVYCHKDDPEMVISPDSGPGGPPPGQSSVIAATSR
jgi:hypothetical protein